MGLLEVFLIKEISKMIEVKFIYSGRTEGGAWKLFFWMAPLQIALRLWKTKRSAY